MAKYVVLAFDNDEDADSFSGTILHGGPSAVGTIQIAGIFKKPTLFCECPGVSDKSVRGAKWGWWLHKDCGKPKRGNPQHPRNLIAPADMSPAQIMRQYLYIGVREGATGA
jgi:hypothetical protein